ncbi:hypothetical protein N431DRAFT_285774, partial [Stipitochalara longipes BDJ]
SNTEHSSRRHAGNKGNSHNYRFTPSHRIFHRSPRNGTNNINRAQDHYLSQVDEPVYNSAYTYAIYPLEQPIPIPIPSEASCYKDQLYYSSTQFPTHKSALYNHEIIFEEEQAPTGLVNSQQYNPSDNQYGSNYYSQTPVLVYDQPQILAWQYPMQQNISTSPTTARWSSQQLAEERIRLGLPRYVTQAEVEAAQRSYED